VTNIFYSATAAYDSGQKKNDNRGELDTRPLGIRDTEAGQSGDSDFFSNTVGVSGIYPYYYGYVTSTNVSAATLKGYIENFSTIPVGATIFKSLLPCDGTFTVNFGVTGLAKFPFFATPSVVDTKVFTRNEFSGAGSFISANAPGVAAGIFLVPSILSISPVENYWANVDYKIYRSGLNSAQANIYYMILSNDFVRINT
jgi:hypothetical protein